MMTSPRNFKDVQFDPLKFQLQRKNSMKSRSASQKGRRKTKDSRPSQRPNLSSLAVMEEEPSIQMVGFKVDQPASSTKENLYEPRFRHSLKKQKATSPRSTTEALLPQ